MHVNTVLDFTILFWIARIAAWLSTKIIIFVFRILSVMEFLRYFSYSKDFCLDDGIYYIFSDGKNFDLFDSLMPILCKNLHGSSI